MDKTPIKKIKTSCAFPILSYDVDVYYNEVRKASGIAFIILELIQKGRNSNEKLSNMLMRFGIPSELHCIFASEIELLVQNQILNSRESVYVLMNKHNFENARINDFTITEKGKKLFAEGAIPTGREGRKTPKIFYSPVYQRYSLKTSGMLSNIESSFLGNGFLDNVKINVTESSIEDYIASVQTDALVGLKEKEMIVRARMGLPNKLIEKRESNMEIAIFDDRVDFTFSTAEENAFFEQYYSSDLMTKCMLMKSKYKFDNDVPSVDWNSINPSNAYTPEEARKQSKNMCDIFLNRGNYGYIGHDKALLMDNSSRYLDMLGENVEFALLSKSGCKAYMPINARIPCKMLGDVFEINLLVEVTPSNDHLRSILMAMYDDCVKQPYSNDQCKTVGYISTWLNESSIIHGYAVSKMNEAVEDDDKVEMILKLNSILSNNKDWADCFKEISESLFNDYINSITIDNVAYVCGVIAPLCKAMNMPKKVYVKDVAGMLKRNESSGLVYEALMVSGFDEVDALSTVNVIDNLASRVLDRVPIDGGAELFNKFAVLSSNMWKLCDMLGVDNLANYTLRDDYNIDEFFNAFDTYKDAKKYIKKYEAYAKAQYKQIEMYESIIENTHEVLSIERTAASHPEKITKEYIDRSLSRGSYPEVISNLLIKAQYDLRILLSLDNTYKADEIIIKAKDEGLISKDEADLLHELRICRNGFQHPETKKAFYSKEKAEKWRDIVFALNGKK